jgi:hypothetical protein
MVIFREDAMSDSVIVRLKPGLSRDVGENVGTLFGAQPGRTRRAFRDIFIESYENIRSAREELSGLGVTVTAIGPSGFEGSAAIAAKPDTINTLTMGRHSHAQLFLSGEILMSLRQGALLVYPLVDGERVRFRLLDLRAAIPFEDERGEQVGAVEANGPIFLHAGNYSIFVFPRGTEVLVCFAGRGLGEDSGASLFRGARLRARRGALSKAILGPKAERADDRTITARSLDGARKAVGER